MVADVCRRNNVFAAARKIGLYSRFELGFQGDLLLPARKDKVNTNADAEILDRQVRICKAFANPTRLRMLDFLGQRDWSVSELQQELAVSKANLSQHLSVLKSAGIVRTRREGRVIHCSLAIPEVKSACHLIRDVLRAQISAGNKLTL